MRVTAQKQEKSWKDYAGNVEIEFLMDSVMHEYIWNPYSKV